MAELHDSNQSVVDDFRKNGGVVGPPFVGVPLLLLHTKGARTGEARLHPVGFRMEGDDYVVFATNAGRPNNPAWFYNLVAHPEVEVELGDRTFDATARVAEGAERERIWSARKAEVPNFADYDRKTKRQIPVVILTAGD